MNTVALALFRMVKKVGRWLIRRLVKFGHTKVMAFVELRIEQVTRRGKRARTKWRKRVNRARIRWRVELLAWLKANRRKHNKAVLMQVERAVDEVGRRIPWDHQSERARA